MGTTKQQQQRTPAPAPQPAAPPAGAIVRVDQAIQRYQVFNMMSGATDSGAAALALKENLGGGTFRAFDFPRTKIPAGGATVFETVNLETGEADYVKSITGIIAYWCDQKSYWAQSLDDRGAKKQPPDCYSPDTIKGIGNPGVLCATCQYNKFGTAKDGKGRGKACKDVRFLFVIREADLIPLLIPCPPTSIPVIKSYMMSLTGRGYPYWGVMTTIALAKATNADQIDYAKVALTLNGPIPALQMPMMRKYKMVIEGMLGRGGDIAGQALATREDLEPAADSGNPESAADSSRGANNADRPANAESPQPGTVAGGDNFDEVQSDLNAHEQAANNAAQ